MEKITKTITRPPGDRKRRLILAVDRYSYLALLALPIIAGLETYYQNRYGEPDVTYIGGFWTAVYGISLLMTFLGRRAGPKKFMQHLKSRGRQIEERVIFSDEGFDTEVEGYFSSRYTWVTLTSFKDVRHHLRFTLAGFQFLLPKKYFSVEELEQIKRLLEAQRHASINQVRPNLERPDPPPVTPD